MKIDRTRNASRNIVYGVVLKIYQLIMPFVMRTAMIYLLGVQYLGLNGLFTSILQVLNLAELGVASAMVYSMYKPIVEDDAAAICALMRLYRTYYRVIGLVICIAGLILLPFLPKLISGDVPDDINVYILYLMNLGATVLTYWLFAYKNSILQAHQRLDVTSKVMLITETIKYLLQFFVLLFFHNYYYFVLVLLFIQVMNNIITAIVSNKMYPNYHPEGKLDSAVVKKLNGKIKDLFTAKLGGTIVNSADTIVISSFLGLTALAVYQNYYYIMSSVIAFIGILLSSCTAGIGNSLIVESIDKNHNDFRTLTFLVSWIAGICVCCFLCIYQPFMTLWVGEEYLLSFSCVVLFSIYFFCFVINSLFCTYKDAAGIWHEDRFRPLIGAIVNLTLNLLLVNQFGIYAILLSTIISYVFVAMPWLIHNLYKLLFKRSCKSMVKRLFLYTAVVIVSGTAVFLIAEQLPGNGIVNIILRLGFCLVIPNILFILFFRKSSEFAGAVDLLNRVTKGKISKLICLLK